MIHQSGPVERARDAASRRDWPEAHRLFTEADNSGLLLPADLALVAQVAYAAGHLDVTIETWERAYAESVRSGDRLAAAGAGVRVAMHLLGTSVRSSRSGKNIWILYRFDDDHVYAMTTRGQPPVPVDE